jgi:RNA polymerase sigma-70 factor (ECF subfamily)
VADVFVALWEQRTAWSPSNGVRAYLFTAVRNRVVDAIRRVQIHARIHDTFVMEVGIPGMSAHPTSVESAFDITEQVDRIFRAIDQFPEARRTVMILYWRNDFSVFEIAQVMGITQNAVYLHLNRGLRTLKQLLLKAPD